MGAVQEVLRDNLDPVLSQWRLAGSCWQVGARPLARRGWAVHCSPNRGRRPRHGCCSLPGHPGAVVVEAAQTDRDGCGWGRPTAEGLCQAGTEQRPGICP